MRFKFHCPYCGSIVSGDWTVVQDLNDEKMELVQKRKTTIVECSMCLEKIPVIPASDNNYKIRVSEN